MSFIKNCLAFSIICFYTSCITQSQPTCIKINEADYNFHLPVNISTPLDTFSIGDTITIISEFSEKMEEINSGRLIDLIDWKLYPRTSLYKIDEEEIIDTSLNTFDVIIDSRYSYSFYEFNDGKVILKGQYLYESGIYKLEYKLIPTKAGLYFHSLGSAIYSFAPDTEFEGKCSNNAIDAYVVLDNIEDSNAIFLLDSPNEDVHIWYERRDKGAGTFNSNGGYVFYVR